jgi:hypothetical protein
MISRNFLMAAPVALLLCLEMGCSSSREVEIKGQVASSATEPLQGPITVQFFDVVDAAKPSLVHSIKLNGVAAFAEKAPLEGNEVLIRAINDRDGNAACSAGEAWAEVRGTIKDDDTIDAVSLDLKADACPTE